MAIYQAIHCFKYNNLRAIARPIAYLLGGYLAENPIAAEATVLVLLHHLRLRERGYNQSMLMAKKLCKITRLPLVKGSLIRQRQSRSQVSALSPTERPQSVARAFVRCEDNLKVKKR
jgi:predicted amidophosphoribosyltransferase